MSARGSTAKMASLSSMSPPPLPAEPESPRVCTLTFILAFLAFVGVGGRLRAVLGRLGLFIFCSLGGFCSVSLGGLGSFSISGGARLLLGGNGRDFLVARERRHFVDCALVDEARRSMLLLLDRLRLLDQRRRIGCTLVARKLDRVADRQPGALVTRDRALDEQQSADRVRADDLEVLLGPVPSTHVTGHLLVLEHA